MKNIILALAAAMCSISAFGTAQISEIIVYNGKTMDMYSLPLQQHPSFKEIKARFASKHTNTALYRGYKSYWSIRNDSLFLDSISSGYNAKTITGSDIFNEIGGTLPIFASWVNKTLHLIGGECVYYIHDDWESKYEDNIFTTIINGKVQSKRSVKNENISKGCSEAKMIEILSDFVSKNCPWLKKGQRIIIIARYDKTDSRHQPIHTEIKILKGEELIPSDQKEEFKRNIGQLIVNEKLIPAAWIDGKLFCPEWYLPLTMH